MDVVSKGFATIGNFDPAGAFGKNLARHDAVGCAEGDSTREGVEVDFDGLHGGWGGVRVAHVVNLPRLT